MKNHIRISLLTLAAAALVALGAPIGQGEAGAATKRYEQPKVHNINTLADIDAGGAKATRRLAPILKPTTIVLGMLEGYDNELYGNNGQAWVGTFGDGYGYRARRVKDGKIAFAAYADVKTWQSRVVPADVPDLATFETRFPELATQAGLDPSQRIPIRFTLTSTLRWMVVNGIGSGQPTPRASFADRLMFGGLQDRPMTAVGFWSPDTGVISQTHTHWHVFTTRPGGAPFVSHLVSLATMPATIEVPAVGKARRR